jgi:hypothetical protein
MARKKAARSRPDSSSPNKVLVVFLVIFILTTLGLGGWVYSIFGERRKGEEQARKFDADAKLAKQDLDWWQLQTYELRAMVGDPAFQDDKTDEYKRWKELRDQFVEQAADVKIKDDSKWKTEKDGEAVKKWIETATRELKWNDKKATYGTNYRDEIGKLRDDLKKAGTDAFAMRTQKNAAQEDLRMLDSKYAKMRSDNMDAVKTGNTAALKAAQERSETMQAEIAANTKLRTEVEQLKKKYADDTRILNAMIKERDEKLASGGGAAPVEKGPSLDRSVTPHALFLDISKGKPLWDRPRGKIVRLDSSGRKVVLDKGAEDGVTVGLGFNVFAPSWDGRAEGVFKGTVEVVRVEPRSSLARVTSLYDAQGNEISLGDPSPSKLLREGGNALKEGDLLFNLTWGSHVAVAGIVDWSGQGVQSPAAQQEELEEFLRVLRSQGVVVDAHIDLRDGQLRGQLTPRTSYLVVGYRAFSAEKAAERVKAVNDGIDALRKECVERGMFLISPDNFINVIGYRRPRSRTDTELSGFRPSMPAGGPVLGVGVVGMEGGKPGESAGLGDLAGKWGGKVQGGGTLRLSIKSDGGCVWQLVVGMDGLTGYSNLGRAGSDFTAVIQNRPVTLRLTAGNQSLQVIGQGLQATLTRE